MNTIIDTLSILIPLAIAIPPMIEETILRVDLLEKVCIINNS